VRKLLIGIGIAMLCSSAASAASMSGVRCEDPQVIDYIKTNLKGMKSEDGQQLSRYLGNNSKLSATTISSHSDGFVCKVSLSLTFGGSTQKIRGRFVYRQFSGDRASVTFIPF
jgi:hypothetical protein